jgi:hypothetical protein
MGYVSPGSEDVPEQRRGSRDAGPSCRTGVLQGPASVTAYCLGAVEGGFGGVAVPLSGVDPGAEDGLEEDIESEGLAGGVELSDGELGGGALDCMDVLEPGADESGPVACCLEHAAASVSALRDKINKTRFIGYLAIVG